MGEEVRFCISCAREFHPGSADVLLCPECGGPPEAVACEPISVGQTLLDANTPPPDSSRTLLEPQPSPPSSRQTILEPSLGRTFTEGDFPAEWQPGDTLLDTYTVSGLLGEGGMGKVYRVHHKSWNIDLAVKSPRPEFFQTQEQKDLFTAEAETWVSLGLHPHIVSCYYVRNLGGIPRVFAELVEGGSLADWIAQGRITTLEQALDIAIQFAWGLAFAHEQGLVHRDVKPANVLMTPDGTAKVTDFGLVKAGKGMTPAYASPEQAEAQIKQIELTPQSDIWSWGLSVLEMFTGNRFWERVDMPDYAWGQVAPQALEHFLSGHLEDPAFTTMPPELAALLQECFQSAPQTRPADMDQVAERLIKIFPSHTGQQYPRQKPKAAELRADSLNNKALSLLDLGKVAEALEAWQQALAADPNHPEATYNFGMYCWQSGQQTDQELITSLKALTNITPDSWLPDYLLGLTHIQRRETDPALQVLSVADRLSPQNEYVKTAINRAQNIEPIRAIRKLTNIHKFIVITTPENCKYFNIDQHHNIFILEMNSGKSLLELKGHSGEVRCLVISPDGNRLISGSDDNTLRVWDLQTGSCEHILQGHTGWIYTIAISPNGKKFVSGSGDHNVRVWDLQSGKCDWVLTGHTGYIKDIKFTPDGQKIITCGNLDKNLRIWDLVTGHCVCSLEGQQRYNNPFTVTPDGQKIIYCDRDHHLIVWDIENNKCLHSLDGHRSDITNLLISHDDSKVVSSSEDRTLRVWNLENGYCFHVLEGHTEPVNTIAFTPDGSKILSTGFLLTSGRSKDNSLRLWDMETGKNQAKFIGHKDHVIWFSVTPNGRYLISGSRDSTVRIWDTENGRCLCTIDNQYPRFITSDGEILITREEEFKGEITIWALPDMAWMKPEWVINMPKDIRSLLAISQEMEQYRRKAQLAVNNQDWRKAQNILINALQTPGFERDNELLNLWHVVGQQSGRIEGLRSAYISQKLSGVDRFITELAITPDSNCFITGGHDSILRVWDLHNESQPRTLKRHNGHISALAITPDGQRVLSSASGDKTILVWDLKSGEYIRTLEGRSKSSYPHLVSHVAITSDGRYALSEEGPYLFVWDLETGKLIQSILGGGVGKFRNTIFALSPDGKSVVSYLGKEWLCLWKLESAKSLRTFKEESDVLALKITPDGEKLVTGCKRCALHIWDMTDGTLLHSLEGHKHNVNRVIITHDSKRIISAAGNSTAYPDTIIRVWDIGTGNLIHCLEGHSSSVNSLALTPDGRTLFSGSSDTTVRMWNLENGKCLHVFEEHKDSLNAVLVSPNGRRLITSGEDHQILIWTIDWDYKFPDSVDWHEGARPYLEQFVKLHTSSDRKLFRRSEILWTEEDVKGLLKMVTLRGYGWLRPEGIRRKLEEMACERG